MSNYHDFRRRSLKRRMRQKIINSALIGVSLVALVGIGWYAVSHTRLFEFETQSNSSSVSETVDENETVVATPEATEQVVEITNQTSIATANTTNSNWNTVNYDIRVLSTEIKYNGDGTTAMDFRLAGQTECGYVDLSYFDGTAFLGDSISQGFEVYDTAISDVGASFFTYQSITPKTIVDLTEVTDAQGNKEVPFDELIASNPDQIYILLGTNTLVADGDYSSFLAYYGILIDMIYEALPDVTIYIQSVTPVESTVRAQKPGLYTSRLMAINDELAALAISKGCYFLNLWDVLADVDGNFLDEYSAADGIHMNTTGYAAWIDYLRSHTVYTPSASYAAGTSYKIEG